MTTRATLDQLAVIVDNALNLPPDTHHIIGAYGRVRLYRDGGSVEVSPSLSKPELERWMRAFIAGAFARGDRGELGLKTSEVGAVVQSLARVLVDRGHSQDQIIHQLRDGIAHDWFREDVFWEAVGGPAVDNLAETLDISPDPEEED